MKKILSLLLACIMLMSCLAACAPAKEPDPTDTPTPTQPSDEPEINPTDPIESNPTVPDETIPDYPDTPVSDGAGFSDFDSKWIAYLDENREGENYLVSPLSLKMAVALAAAGANTQTLDEILAAFGYETLDEYLAWGKNIMAYEKEMQERMDMKSGRTHETDEESDDNTFFMSSIYGQGYDEAFSIENGIWHNSDKPGQFTELYKEYMTELDALFKNTPGAELKDEINEWVNEKTEGMIPVLFTSDLSSHTNILVNTLYMKCNWVEAFEEMFTEEGDFTTIDGEVVKKEMMNQENKYAYYSDKSCELLILDLENGFKMAFVLGDNSNIVNKINQAERQLVNVTIPKFDLESGADDIVPFLQSQGMKLAFDNQFADFSNMMDTGNYISDIIQKTKLEVGENGIKAAAVTAMTMDATSAIDPNIPEPIYFIADEPFSFYIYAEIEEGATPELMFFGRYVK